MKKIVLILTIILFLLLILFFVFSNKAVFLLSSNSSLNFNKDFSLLLLGKPGPGYIGSENTDSIMVIYYSYKKNKIFIIPIPRDLVVYDEKGNLQKINALYSESKLTLLFKKISDFTGLEIKNYLAVDLDLVLKLIDEIGGIEINLEHPVTDAVTLYTLPAGKQKINGYLAELIIRSRYNQEGDFFRIKNQMKIISALKEKIINLDSNQKLSLIRFLERNKYHWQTNLEKKEILSLILQIKDLKGLEIIPIVIDFNSGLLSSNYFTVYNTLNVYGIYPKDGIDKFDKIKIYIWSKINEKLR